jgi:hypothetical protein
MRPKGSFQVGIGLPVSLANEVFKGIMQGLVNGSILYNYTLKNSISFGAGVNYTYFNVNEFKVNEPLFGGMHTPAAFLKIGLEKFHSSNFGTDFSIKVGYAESFITTNLNRENGVDPYRVSSTYFEPIIGLILVGDEETAFKFNFSFATYGFGFRPNYLGLKSNAGYDPVDFTKVVTHISVGFSYVHYFRMY